MVEKWGWRLPLAAPQGWHVRQHPRPSVGSPWGPQKEGGSASWWTPLPSATMPWREETQKKLPSNVDSSAHAQDLPKGGLWPKAGLWQRMSTMPTAPMVCWVMRKSVLLMELKLPVLLIVMEGKLMSWQMIRESQKLCTLRFHFYFTSNFSSGFFFRRQQLPAFPRFRVVWPHH